MGLIGNMKKWLKTKENEASEALENGNEVAFAEQDLADMEKKHREVANNLGRIKASKLGLERDIKEKNDEIKKRTSDAESLLAANKEELAAKHCAIVEDRQAEIGALKEALKKQNDLLAMQEKNRSSLSEAIDQAKRDLKIMKTMSDVVKSNESLAVVDTSGTQSALGAFQDRKRKMQEKFDTSSATVEAQYSNTAASLDDETNAILGNTKGSSMLDKLKAKNANK